MRSYEIINESISFTKYAGGTRDDIVSGIIRGVEVIGDQKNLYMDYLPQIVSYNTLKIPKFLKDLNLDVGNTAANLIREDLGRRATDIVIDNNITNNPVWVIFDNTSTARGATLAISNRPLIKIIDLIIRNLIETVNQKQIPNNKKSGNRADIVQYSNSELFDKLFILMKERNLIMSYIEQPDIRNAIDELVSNFIHEMVHIRQNYIQFLNKRYDPEYRSYLDKEKGEFNTLARYKSDKTARYMELYRASPQEITAFSHMAALDVIKSFGLNTNNLTDIHIPPNKEVLSKVVEHVKKYYNAPETFEEKKVYNRYIKQTYLEVEEYLNHIRQN